MKHAFFSVGMWALTMVVGCGGNNGVQDPAPAQVQPPPAAPLKSEPVEELAKPKTISLIHAATVGNVNDVKAYLRTDPESIKSADGIGMQPIHLAAINGHVEVLQILLKA